MKKISSSLILMTLMLSLHSLAAPSAVDEKAMVEFALQSTPFSKKIKRYELEDGKLIASKVEVVSATWGTAIVSVTIQSQKAEDLGFQCEISSRAFFNPNTGAVIDVEKSTYAKCM